MNAHSDVRILIADDHEPARRGVRTALEGQGFVVCAEAADADGAVEAAQRERPQLCLLEVFIPGGGIAAARAIHDRVPEAALVILTVSADEQHLLDALGAGASGYLLKGTDPARLHHALRGVLDGEAALPRQLTARLIDEFRHRGRRRRLPLLRRRGVELTPREWDVTELMREGRSTREIAERLSVSPVTVRRHASTVVRKLRVDDRRAAIRLLEQSAARPLPPAGRSGS